MIEMIPRESFCKGCKWIDRDREYDGLCGNPESPFFGQSREDCMSGSCYTARNPRKDAQAQKPEGGWVA